MAITGCCARRKGREKVKVLEFHGRQAARKPSSLGPGAAWRMAGKRKPDFCMMEITQKGDRGHRNSRSIGLK